MAITVLTDHTSPETAHVTADYPYGYTLRCQRRAWLEFNPKHGYRFVTQTSNPKRPGLVWNKPKASTYTTLAAMYLDEDGHVQWAGLSCYATLAQVEAFATTYAAALTGEREQKILTVFRHYAQRMAERRYTATLTPAEESV